jgi:hypothetical protein
VSLSNLSLLTPVESLRYGAEVVWDRVCALPSAVCIVVLVALLRLVAAGALGAAACIAARCTDGTVTTCGLHR